MRKPRWVTKRSVAVFTLSLLVTVAVVLALVPRSSTSSGERAPTFEVPDLRNPERQMSLAVAGGRPLVLNFWATWCVPCRKEMPVLQAVHASLGDRVTFLGMNERDSRRLALKFLDETGVDYASGFDPPGRVGAAYALFGLPTTVFISPDGRIVERHLGQLNERKLRDLISRAFDIR